jgi:hypothetical protein
VVKFIDYIFNFYFNTLYRASFIVLYYDQQMHNYFTNYHTNTCFDTIVSSSDSLQSINLPSYVSMSNAAVGNTVYNYNASHRFYVSSHSIVLEISVL